jgi:hypothetical protein
VLLLERLSEPSKCQFPLAKCQGMGVRV